MVLRPWTENDAARRKSSTIAKLGANPISWCTRSEILQVGADAFRAPCRTVSAPSLSKELPCITVKIYVLKSMCLVDFHVSDVGRPQQLGLRIQKRS